MSEKALVFFPGVKDLLTVASSVVKIGVVANVKGIIYMARHED